MGEVECLVARGNFIKGNQKKYEKWDQNMKGSQNKELKEGRHLNHHWDITNMQIKEMGTFREIIQNQTRNQEDKNIPILIRRKMKEIEKGRGLIEIWEKSMW